MNAQTKHTPGPWEVQGNNIVATRGNVDVCVICYSGEHFTGEDKANARLIAAAPALLEALKEANQHLAVVGFPRDSRGKYDKHGEWGFGEAMPNEADAAEVKNAFVAIRAAIAKATGEVTP